MASRLIEGLAGVAGHIRAKEKAAGGGIQRDRSEASRGLAEIKFRSHGFLLGREREGSLCSLQPHFMSRKLARRRIVDAVSRAFVKEDVDPPERSGRKRSAAGLPPGATNYITARGAKRLRDELQELHTAKKRGERVAELEQILESIQVVDPRQTPSDSISFGATVTVKDKKGVSETYTVVGVDELDLEPDAVSWISALGKALLNAEIGDWITLENGRSAKIEKVEYRRSHACD